MPSTRRSTLGDGNFRVAAARAWNASLARATTIRRDVMTTLFEADI